MPLFTALLGGKIAVTKIAAISAATATVSDFITGSVTYHYWDRKKRKTITFKKRKKKERW